jgi:ATP-binding cassette subfamily C protein LapB
MTYTKNSTPLQDVSLMASLSKLAELQRESVSRLALKEAVEAAQCGSKDTKTQLSIVADHLGIKPAQWLKAPDAAQVPILMRAPDGLWSVLIAQNAQGQWMSQRWDDEQRSWIEETQINFLGYTMAKLKLIPPFDLGESPVFSLIRNEIRSNTRLLLDAALGGLMIGLLGLITSFYSMQIYDRVIPTGAMQTLLVLSLGAVIAVILDWLARSARTKLYENLIEAVDQRLARLVYQRFLAIRLDQMPRSVGSLAAQMRGYESVRGFLTQATTSMLVDLPFALLFLGLIAILGGSLALVPLVFFVVAIAFGLSTRKRMEQIAKRGTAAGNFKTGLLVETVEGAETLKSGQGGWRMLSRWLKSTDEARDVELESRRLNDHFQHLMSSFQQFSYILLVAFGAWLVSRGELSQGGLIACSILAGRVLNPVTVIASQTLQWASAKASLEGLDALWKLEDDHHGHDPIMLEHIRGNYRFEKVSARYGVTPALIIPQLQINAGERIGVIGPVGAGKSTLLRLLSGMYKPAEGQIFLDDVDLSHIAKPPLSETVGYLQQEGRLFAGSLRENLLLGLIDPGDKVILDAAKRTGLMQAVIAAHPKGLQQEIFEGGTGLSGGQRQLVNLTRVLMRNPTVWLLDEPTASVDGNVEQQLVSLLQQSIKPHDTLVLVTHKPEMLRLVQRIIVIANHQIVMDGPADQVMAQLQSNSQAIPA